MNRIAFVALCLLSSGLFARADAATLCPAGGPATCVVPNWGQIQPGSGVDASTATTTPSLAAAPAQSPHLAVRMMPAAVSATSSAAAASPLKSVVSPQGLFPKETAALVAALQRARFDDEGGIRSGEAAIRRAAEEAAHRAGDRYTLTLFIQVPQKLPPDRSDALARKVETLNTLLSPGDRAPLGLPRS